MQHKLSILAAAAKYDVSCSSSGGRRSTPAGGMGNSAPAGVCHSFTEDGRCVSLLKVLLTNVCIQDCAYCINRRSNDIPRATFRVEEVVQLTLEFYKRNYIEGLFLSSGIIRSADYTMEALVRVAQTLRMEHRFGGYIHLKAIPGASPELIQLAGLYADRLSVNLELPSDASLRQLAPGKSFAQALAPMAQIHAGIASQPKARILPGTAYSARDFVPAGQSTQLIVGASPESDFQILSLSSHLYEQQGLKRVYFSGYIPINQDPRLPTLNAAPLLRENRLYQADWLMRFYQFRADEILDAQHPFLDPQLDPKLAWALRHPEIFPLDLDRASFAEILRVPGIGVRSARLLLAGRRFTPLRPEHMKRLGIAWNRARFFVQQSDLPHTQLHWSPQRLRQIFLPQSTAPQLDLFTPSLTPRLAS